MDLWPFIDELQFFKSPKQMRVGLGLGPKPSQACRYHGDLVFSGSNQQAKELVLAAHKDTYVWREKWGTLRVDLDFLEKKMRNAKKPLRGHYLKTWRWMHCPPPKIYIWGSALHEIDLSLGWKFSLDFHPGAK